MKAPEPAYINIPVYTVQALVRFFVVLLLQLRREVKSEIIEIQFTFLQLVQKPLNRSVKVGLTKYMA